MNLKEKSPLKLEILKDIRSCFGFSFGSVEEQLSHFKLNNLIVNYANALEEDEKNENKN